MSNYHILAIIDNSYEPIILIYIKLEYVFKIIEKNIYYKLANN